MMPRRGENKRKRAGKPLEESIVSSVKGKQRRKIRGKRGNKNK